VAKDHTPAKVGNAKPPAEGTSSRADIEAFLRRASEVATFEGKRGRLIFGLDATMSRQPTWDTAARLQGEMFEEAGKVGGLEVQLVYYRGFAECRASRWVGDTRALRDLMTAIECRGGQTQIRKVLAHARRETGKQRVQALVFVGDAVEEPVDALSQLAGELGLLGVPAFMFQEGHDASVETAFREIARLTRGAYVRFNQAAAGELASLLRAVAMFAAGGRKALTSSKGRGAQLLLEQLR
jgi:hypothetical protein